MTDVRYLLLATALAWLMIMTASTLKNREWTLAGLRIGFGNRDGDAATSPVAGRADRAAKNMLENLVVFVALFAAARFRGASASELLLGSAVFFWARLAYWFVYLIGIPYLRTAIWAIALVGMGLVARAAW